MKTKSITIRCTEAQAQFLNDKSEQTGLSISALLRNFSIGNIDDTISKKDARKIIGQVAKIGNNLNQIAYRVNADRVENGISEQTYLNTIDGLNKVSLELKNILIINKV